MLQKRGPVHRKGFLFWMLISPLTAPFMLIRELTPLFLASSLLNVLFPTAIIPNLPFFFCVWRSYHHYRGMELLVRVLCALSVILL